MVGKKPVKGAGGPAWVWWLLVVLTEGWARRCAAYAAPASTHGTSWRRTSARIRTAQAELLVMSVAMLPDGVSVTRFDGSATVVARGSASGPLEQGGASPLGDA